MASPLSQPPFRQPIASQDGTLTVQWSNWLVDLYQRIGGVSAKTNVELDSGSNTLASTVSALSATVSTQGTAINSLQSTTSGFALSNGRAL